MKYNRITAPQRVNVFKSYHELALIYINYFINLTASIREGKGEVQAIVYTSQSLSSKSITQVAAVYSQTGYNEDPTRLSGVK